MGEKRVERIADSLKQNNVLKNRELMQCNGCFESVFSFLIRDNPLNQR